MEITITNNNGTLTVSSVQVAENFNKRHKDVIEKIKNLLAETSAEFSANLFTESVYTDTYGRQQKCYDLTRDGFSLLVMGFTGKKALEWKLKYIEAFNKMEQALISQNSYSVLSQLFVNMDNRQRELESKQAELEKKVADVKKIFDDTSKEKADDGRISTEQQKHIAAAVKKVCVDTCQFAETYVNIGEEVEKRIREALYKNFGIKSYSELYSRQYKSAIDFLQAWEPDGRINLLLSRNAPTDVSLYVIASKFH